MLNTKTVIFYVDGFVAARIVGVGSPKTELQNIALDIFQFCRGNFIQIEVVWIPRSLNSAADHLSFFFIYRSKKNVKNTKLIHFYVPATAGKDTWSSGLHCGWHLQFNYTKYNKKAKTNKG